MSEIEYLGDELAKVFLRLHRLLDRRMTAQGASMSRTKILFYLERQLGEARASAIAEFFALAPRTVTDALDGLERDGLLRREPDPNDRRVKQLFVTKAGCAAIAATEPLRCQLTQQIFGSLAPDQQQQLRIILDLLALAIAAEEQRKAD